MEGVCFTKWANTIVSNHRTEFHVCGDYTKGTSNFWKHRPLQYMIFTDRSFRLPNESLWFYMIHKHTRTQQDT